MDGVVHERVGLADVQTLVAIGPAHQVRRCTRLAENLDNLAASVGFVSAASSQDDVITDTRLHRTPPVTLIKSN